MAKRNSVSIDGTILLEKVIRGIEKGKSSADVADELGVTKEYLNGRLVQIRKNVLELHPGIIGEEIVERSYFPKGPGTGGKKKGSINKVDMSALVGMLAPHEQVIADLTGADAETVQENGMSLVQKENCTKDDYEAAMTEVEKHVSL